MDFTGLMELGKYKTANLLSRWAGLVNDWAVLNHLYVMAGGYLLIFQCCKSIILFNGC